MGFHHGLQKLESQRQRHKHGERDNHGGQHFLRILLLQYCGLLLKRAVAAFIRGKRHTHHRHKGGVDSDGFGYELGNIVAVIPAVGVAVDEHGHREVLNFALRLFDFRLCLIQRIVRRPADL